MWPWSRDVTLTKRCDLCFREGWEPGCWMMLGTGSEDRNRHQVTPHKVGIISLSSDKLCICTYKWVCKYWLQERVTLEIVTPIKPLSTKAMWYWMLIKYIIYVMLCLISKQSRSNEYLCLHFLFSYSVQSIFFGISPSNIDCCQVPSHVGIF